MSETTGFLNLTTFSSVANAGSLSTWSSPSNAQTSNDTAANATVGTGIVSATSEFLRGVQLVSASVPSDAQIVGVEVTVERLASSTVPPQCKDSSLQLVKGGSATGTNNASASFWNEGSDTTVTYGGPTDLWGTTLTASDVTASNFGVQLSITNTSPGSGATTGAVDQIRMKIYYNLTGMFLVI